MADMAASPPPQKFSRYRSQRKTLAQVTAEELPAAASEPLLEESIHDDGIARSKSRYRRTPSRDGMRPATANDQDLIAAAPRPQSSRVSPAKQGYQRHPFVRVHSQRQSAGARGYQDHNVDAAQPGAQEDTRRTRSQEIDWEVEEERRQRLKDRFSVQRNSNSLPSPAKPVPAADSPVGELFPPPRPEPVKRSTQPAVLDGPPTSDQIRATKSVSQLPTYESDDDEAAGCFGLFKRKRGDATPLGEKTRVTRVDDSREPPTIRPGGGGVVPGTDAPVSAVNAGDRHVLVECGKSKTMFPVNTTTTPVDIIKSASLCMRERIDVKSAVLIESFGTVGIQRPLRRYEHVRDVMNSWDTDTQDSLILVDPGTGTSEKELSVAGVPLQKPGDESWFLSISQKVGKWDKRFITLKSDGLMTMQKDPNKSSDVVNVCHLSDFDIYTPTQEKARKKIKPPKKICFAIKSQQKTSMFESTHDFVHFFCTNDRRAADDFYAAVQEWRSWYLVNVMGEGKKSKPHNRSAGEKDLESGDLYGKTNHQSGNSLESRYQLGTFKPLLGTDDFEKSPAITRAQEIPPPSSAGFKKSSNQFDTTISPERRTSTVKRKQQHLPALMGNKPQLAEDEPLVNLGRRDSVNRSKPSPERTKANPEEFLSTGLLGRSYSQRQRDTAEREIKPARPFTSGPNLLNSSPEKKEAELSGRRSLDGGPRRSNSKRVQSSQPAVGISDLQRTDSHAREKPKPLVDLTPQYREPPQHIKKGKGFNPESAATGPLIENATSPEDPLGIPPSTDWRNRNASSPHDRTNSLSRTKPNAQSVRRPATSREAPAPSAFTGEGLLAGAQGQSGWGGGERGRGVMDGSHAKGPMVDLTKRSEFVHGSLVGKAERDDLSSPPVIDREREDGTPAW